MSVKSYMQNLVYIVAIEFIIAWLLGFFVYNGGYLFHIFLVVAIVIIIVRVTRINHISR